MSTETTDPRPSATGSEPTISSPRPSYSPWETAAPHGEFTMGSGSSPAYRGKQPDPPWARPALVGLLVATGALYLWGLGASGWANSFYSAAVQAGSASWKSFFFGSSDAASSITVDKTPMSLWVMATSVRLFGLSSWSILVPQALMGVASVGLLHSVVRRTTGSAGAGLLAGAVLALTPVAVLMFRFNNPDALLVLLLIGSVAATLRALDSAHPVRWLALGGALVGFAFLTKMLQAFLVLPALAAVYLLAANTSLGKRVGHLLVAFGTMLVAGAWWVAIVELWPASSRPYIGGSQHNSILELTLGYNGLGRLSGDEVGSVGGGGGTGGRWGSTGILRLFSSEVGGQVAWLLPAALVLLGAGLWLTRRAPRTDRVRAGLVVWGGWLLVTGLIFSFMAGIFHAYYTVALAPAIAALVGIGATVLWRRRDSYAAALVLACTLALTTALAFFLLDRATGFVPWLKWVVALTGFVSALLLVARRHLSSRAAAVAAGTAVLAVLLGPAAYAVSTAATPHTGSIPTAGPSIGGGPGGMGGPGGPPAMGGPGGLRHMGGPAGAVGVPPQGAPPAPGATGQQNTPGATGQQNGPGGTGGMGGLLDGSTPTARITAMLRSDADAYTWAAAAVGANNAAGYQLASGQPVMAIGGFNGSDPSPTLAQFRQYVGDGEIHYFIASGDGHGAGGPMSATGSTSSEIASWVASHFTSRTVDGVTVYDLSGGVR